MKKNNEKTSICVLTARARNKNVNICSHQESFILLNKKKTELFVVNGRTSVGFSLKL